MSVILERVRKIVIEHLDADPEKVNEKASFIDDLGADSLDNVELVMAFEEEFDIEIPDDAAEHIQTVGDAVKFISERLGASSDSVLFDAVVADSLGGGRVVVSGPNLYLFVRRRSNACVASSSPVSV